MLKYLILVALASTASGSTPHRRLVYSAATPAQTRFAIENKYDGTGPGAKNPETNGAYETYNNLEDALVAYIDDPDTKLPDHERAKALDKLSRLNQNLFGYEFKRPFFYDKGFGFENVQTDISLKQVDLSPLRNSHHLFPEFPSYQSPFKWQKLKEIRPKQLSLSHYTQQPDYEQYDTQLQYTFNPLDNSADSARLSETRSPAPSDGVRVAIRQKDDPYRGYFKYWDSTGERTVHYEDDTERL